MSESTLNVQPAPDDPTPRTKREPKPPSPLVHVYSPSDDGIDENLLILLHGLGELTLLSWHGNTLLRHHPTVVFTGSRRYAHTIRKTWGTVALTTDCHTFTQRAQKVRRRLTNHTARIYCDHGTGCRIFMKRPINGMNPSTPSGNYSSAPTLPLRWKCWRNLRTTLSRSVAGRPIGSTYLGSGKEVDWLPNLHCDGGKRKVAILIHNLRRS